jgi:hypothetical protein
VSKVEEIERVIDQLPAEDFEKLSAWMEQKRRAGKGSYPKPAAQTAALRDHSAFLNGYSPEDEGIYDDAGRG